MIKKTIQPGQSKKIVPYEFKKKLAPDLKLNDLAQLG